MLFESLAVKEKVNPDSVLPAGFKVPDMSPLNADDDSEKYERETIVEFPHKVGDRELRVKFTFIRLKDDEHPSHKARVHLESYDDDLTDGDPRLSSFKATLVKEVVEHDHAAKNDKSNLHWHIHTRRIDKSLRGKGYGQWNMKALEEAIRKVADENPDLRANWIQLDTMLGSISNLVVDPDWLMDKLQTYHLRSEEAEDILYERAAKKDKNLGYIPHPKDISKAINLLLKKTEELDDVPKGQKSVRYVKPLRSDFDPETDFWREGESRW